MSEVEYLAEKAHDEMLVQTTKLQKEADTFGRFIWPIVLIILTAFVARYVPRSETPWHTGYSPSPARS